MRKFTNVAMGVAMALSPVETGMHQLAAEPCGDGVVYSGAYQFEEQGPNKGQPTDPARMQAVVSTAVDRYLEQGDPAAFNAALSADSDDYTGSWPFVFGLEGPESFWANHGITDAAVPAAYDARDAFQRQLAQYGLPQLDFIPVEVGVGGPDNLAREEFMAKDWSIRGGAVAVIVMGHNVCSPVTDTPAVDPR